MDVHMINYLKNYLIVRKGRINMHTSVNDLAMSLEAFECSFLKLKPAYLVCHRTSKKNIR